MLRPAPPDLRTPSHGLSKALGLSSTSMIPPVITPPRLPDALRWRYATLAPG
jgi:hypothetical protein